LGALTSNFIAEMPKTEYKSKQTYFEPALSQPVLSVPTIDVSAAQAAPSESKIKAAVEASLRAIRNKKPLAQKKT
jgi:hypothetical protein